MQRGVTGRSWTLMFPLTQSWNVIGSRRLCRRSHRVWTCSLGLCRFELSQSLLDPFSLRVDCDHYATGAKEDRASNHQTDAHCRLATEKEANTANQNPEDYEKNAHEVA